ncbi:hypothetical protein [Bacillus sp. OK048]|uniref:hypothetical protein n=1 Tax=Bacillus sp. OK048 TaxID=1882761 RepID=UPI000883A751|nr:hypothetical protein [Bacillus sp. OK048]SDM42060.1 hypothetical protein SAMN05443253_103250 [Bacillus sp. OK048]
MKRYTHAKCLRDVIEDGLVIFKSGEIYKITGFDYNSLVYYVEPEFYPEDPLPEEFVIPPLHPDFEFLTL